jgi:lycopene beta-cyclase
VSGTVVLAGGGLANSLIAWRLLALRPEVPVCLLERGATLGGNHTWSFHGGDLTPEQLQWVRPLVAHAWPAQRVRFPEYERRIETPYYSITSERLHGVAAAALGPRARLGAEIVDVQPHGVRLGSGEVVEGSLVIDGRGVPAMRRFDLRWQKFLGLELDLARPHDLTAPLLMDATVTQQDGYRFVYVLPLAPQRLLIEDTYYSESPDLRIDELRSRVHAYAAAGGFDVAGVVREETGVLPIVLDGDVGGFWSDAGVQVPRAGMTAMLFHHTTGYSLPDAVRLADVIAMAPDLSSAAVAVAIRDLALRRWREQRFFRLLNRLMFEAAAPPERYRTLQHFYRQPAALISRFYSGHVATLDPLRVLSGKPPVPIGRALRCIARSLMPGHAIHGSVPRRRSA